MNRLSRNRKLKGGLLAFIGFMLSPLSWWNDLFVNIPLAALLAWGVSSFYPPAFQISLVIGYWLTNVLGLVLLHRGTQQMTSSASPLPFSRRALAQEIAICLIYTLAIVAMVKWRILQPPPQFLLGH